MTSQIAVLLLVVMLFSPDSTGTCAGVTLRGVRALLFVLCVDADMMTRHLIQ
jgi:hypothetical protein